MNPLYISLKRLGEKMLSHQALALLIFPLLLFSSSSSVASSLGEPSSVIDFDIDVYPSEPTTRDDIRIRLSGVWPHTCTPQYEDHRIDGHDIYIFGETAFQGGLNVPCFDDPTRWSFTVRIGRLEEGRYTVYAYIYDRFTDIEREKTATFEVIEACIIWGQVCEDTDQDGRCDPGEPPLSYVTIRLLDEDDREINTWVTGRAGLYEFTVTDIEYGDIYYVVERDPSGYRSVNENRIRVAVEPGERIYAGDFCDVREEETLYSISGRVTDNTGAPISGAAVSATGPTEASTTTGGDGRYALSDLPAGLYFVRVSKEGYASPSARGVTVPPDAANVDFVLHFAGCLRGHVVDADTDQSIPGVRIALWGGDDSEFYVTTDANGDYEVGNMPFSGYWGWAIRDGYYDRKGWSISVIGNGCARGDFEMYVVPMELSWPIDEEDEDLNGERTGITSWFDHEYPIGNYQSGEPSPPVTVTTTLRDFTGLLWDNRSYSGHEGIDIALGMWDRADSRTGRAEGRIPVLAAAGGDVVLVASTAGFGNHVVIDHNNGFLTLYGHLHHSSVAEGESIGAGDEIGGAGSTGNSTGTHLHFGVYRYLGPPLRGSVDVDYVVDPCGWIPRNRQDPWVTYGDGHPPSSEVFLERCAPQTTVASVGTSSSFTSREGDVTINVPAGAADAPLALRYVPVPIGNDDQGRGHDGDPTEPRPPAFPGNLVRVGPSFFLDAYTLQEQPVDTLRSPMTLVLHYDPASLGQIHHDSIQVYRWDPDQAAWVGLPTSLETASTTATGRTATLSTATAQTEALGLFALLALRRTPIVYTISGQVTDDAGIPISDAILGATGPTEVSTATSSDGHYTLPDLLAGTYIVSVSKEGYVSPRVRSVTVPPDALNMDFVLQRQPQTYTVYIPFLRRSMPRTGNLQARDR